MKQIREYFNYIVEVLDTNSKVAGIQPHRPDIGSNRENIVKEFLNKHLPSSLNATIGGQILGFDGGISQQVDIIISNDISIRFNQHDKTFVTAEGVAAVITVKSVLDKTAIHDCLLNLHSAPDISKSIISFRGINPQATDEFIKWYPKKFIFAFDGLAPETLIAHIKQFYVENPQIPSHHYPELIIVNKKYEIIYSDKETKTHEGTVIPAGTFHLVVLGSDFQGHPLLHMLDSITKYLDWLPYMRIDFHHYINKAMEELVKR